MRIFLLIIVIICLGTVASYFFIEDYYNHSTLPTQETTIVVPKGAPLGKIATLLEQNGAIKYAPLFTQIAKFTNQTNAKHGEYKFAPNSSPREILRKLVAGEVVERKFTIAEGKTAYDILQILSRLEAVTGTLPENLPEGSVLPQTYHYEYGDDVNKIIAQMQTEMQKTLAAEWEKRNLSSILKTPQEALILASIVEKETGLDGERGLVASVFLNRLKIGMPLQSDPTAVYGITFGAALGDKVRAKHVDDNNPFNTYKIAALPPTPICSAGVEALRAVLNPPESQFLYFVANGAGGHNFAKTLAEHNANVEIYRQALKAKTE